MEATDIKFNTLIRCAGAVLLVELAARFTLFRGPWPMLVSLGALRILEIILLVGILVEQGIGLAPLGFTTQGLRRGLLGGLIWSLGFGALVMVGCLLLVMLGVNPSNLFRVQLPKREIDLILYVIVGSAIAPVAEEFFFRGILYGFLRRWGVLTAVSVSTLIFVAIHPTGRNVPFTQAIGGVLFALSYEVEKTLVTPIMIHVLGNLAIFTLGIVG